MKLTSQEVFLKHTQTPGSRHEIDEIIGPLLFIQTIFAHQILDTTWTWRKNALKIICIVALLAYVIWGTIDFIKTTDDFHLFIEAVFTLVIIYQFTFQILFFVIYRVVFREVYTMAKLTMFGIIEEISPDRSAYLIKLFRNMIKSVFFLFVAPSVQYIGTGLWFYFTGKRVTLSPSTSILMPISSPTFEIGLVLHAGFFIMVASGTITVNMWFIFLTCFFCEACDCAVKVLKVEESDSVAYTNNLNKALKNFYTIHVHLMKYLNALNDLYTWPLLIPLFAVVTLTCVFMLVSTEEVNWKLAIVVFIKFVEVSGFNLLGERIKSKAEEMRSALLNFNWLNLSVEQRKSYFIILGYLNNDVGVHTAVGVDLSLLTLSTIYKGSYQAYAVFNTMNN